MSEVSNKPPEQESQIDNHDVFTQLGANSPKLKADCPDTSDTSTIVQLPSNQNKPSDKKPVKPER